MSVHQDSTLHHHSGRRAFIALIVVAMALPLLGCGHRGIGTGLLLWSPDESVVASGTLLTVLSQSDLNDTYKMTGDMVAGPFEVARWRVDLYTDPEAAQKAATAYADAFSGNTQLYATATRNALPIRSEAVASATNTVYRLREGEEIKLIGRAAEQVDLQGLVSYWYEALTSTGARGWVFGYTLKVFDPTDASVVVDTGGNTDPLIDLLLQNVWRPVYFADMIANGTIDLNVFKPEYGLFPDPENHQLELVLPYHSTIFEYDDITRVGSRRYIATGTSLQMTFQRDDELSIQYLYNDQQFILAMQRIPGKIEDYVQQEVDRRTALYEDLMSRGPSFTSDNYGTLTLLDGQRFTWEGYDRLIPTAVPKNAGATGSIDLGLFLSDDLKSQYDGALSFTFDSTKDPVSFVYAFRDGGIRLVWVPAQDIDDRLVLRGGVSPVSIFMSGSGG